jgi:hypothetical protein
MSNKAVVYTIYRTTNQVNGKVYIGKHQTHDINDKYLGSGKLLKQAIKKYGVENFTKEILYTFDNEDDMNAKERKLVTEDFVLQKNNYNLCVGGHGGWSYVNRELPNGMLGKMQTVTQKKAACNWISRNQGKLQKKTPARTAHIKQLAELNKGRRHTKKTKKRMSQNRLGKGAGIENSQFDTIWITNGCTNKKISRHDLIPAGWTNGKTMPPSITQRLRYCQECNNKQKRITAQNEAKRLYKDFLQSGCKTASEYVAAGNYPYSVVSLTQKWKRYVPEYQPVTGRGNKKLDH